MKLEGVCISSGLDEVSEDIVPESNRDILNHDLIPLSIEEHELRASIKNGVGIRRGEVEANGVAILAKNRGDDIVEGHIDVTAAVKSLTIFGRSRWRVGESRAGDVHGKGLNLLEVRITGGVRVAVRLNGHGVDPDREILTKGEAEGVGSRETNWSPGEGNNVSLKVSEGQLVAVDRSVLERVAISRAEGDIDETGFVNLGQSDLGSIKARGNLCWDWAITGIHILCADDDEICRGSLNRVAPDKGVVCFS